MTQDRATRRFHVPAGTLGKARVQIEGPLARRLVTVLRLASGAEVLLFDGTGTDTLVRIEHADQKRVEARAIETRPGPAESPTAVHLFQSITKGERFEWLVEKATEIGVASVTPLTTARAVVRTPAGGQRAERWHRIAVEAAEQCGRSVVPSVGEPLGFGAALAQAPGVVLLPYEEAGMSAPGIADILRREIDAVFSLGAISVLIGPEGGFEPAEVENASRAGAHVVSLGERVLRSETAGLVAVTLALAVCGQLG